MEKNKTCNRPWRYSLAMFGLSIAGYMYVTYGTFFYTETIGLSMKLIALGNVLYAVWDAFNDPIAGYLSDRTRTRWGRRKPWLLASVPVFVLSSILFFSPPASLGTGVGLAVYFTVFLMLTETGNTISTVNYHSLLPELYRDEKRRNQANALRQAMQLVGMIIGVSLVPMITAAIGYRATALALGLLSGALILYSILGCRERSEFSQSEQPGLLASLKALATNANFWLVSVSHFFYQSTSGLLLAGIPFYIKYALQLPDSNATFLSAAVFVSAIPSMYLWYRLMLAHRAGVAGTFAGADVLCAQPAARMPCRRIGGCGHRGRDRQPGHGEFRAHRGRRGPLWRAPRGHVLRGHQLYHPSFQPDAQRRFSSAVHAVRL